MSCEESIMKQWIAKSLTVLHPPSIYSHTHKSRNNALLTVTWPGCKLYEHMTIHHTYPYACHACVHVCVYICLCKFLDQTKLQQYLLVLSPKYMGLIWCMHGFLQIQHSFILEDNVPNLLIKINKTIDSQIEQW